MTEPFLDQKMIHQLLEYNRETGLFTWRERPGKKAWNTRYSGKTAGSRWSPDGKTTYIVIRIFDWPFLAHRLAILYVTGIWPDALVDHENTDGTDNRWENLREATAAENGANRSKNSNNTSGFKGVSRTKNGKFRATIQVRGFWKQIGIMLIRLTHIGARYGEA